MAKKLIKTKDSLMSDSKHMILPSTVGGVIAWLFSASLGLGAIVFVAVWLGNWMGHMFLRRGK